MNVHAPSHEFELARWRFTVRDVERMVEVGILSEGDRVELIEGELIEMAPKGDEHEGVKDPLVMRIARSIPDPLSVSVETTLKLSSDTIVEPDLIIYDASNGRAGLNAEAVLLAVEVSVSTLAYDLNRKPLVYAAHGVRELWVIDVVGRTVRVHRDPSNGTYADAQDHPVTRPLAPLLVPNLSITFADFM